jgi:hypothetical protein
MVPEKTGLIERPRNGRLFNDRIRYPLTLSQFNMQSLTIIFNYAENTG